MIKTLEEETGSCKNISGSEENRDQQHLEELKELKEANAKSEADKIREKDLEQGKTSEKTTRTWRMRGQKNL